MLLGTTVFDLARLVRNVPYVVFTIGFPVGFYILYSHMFGMQTAFAGTIWPAYFLVSMATFGAIGTTLNVTGTQISLDRESGWAKFLRLTPLSPSSYVLSKALTASTASLAISLIVTAVGLASGVALPTGTLAEVIVIVWIGSLAFTAIGLAMAQLLDAHSIGYGTTLVYLGMSFLGGLWTPLKVLPHVFTSIASFLPSYRVAHVAWTVLAGQPIEVSDVAVVVLYLVAFGLAGGLLYGRRQYR